MDLRGALRVAVLFFFLSFVFKAFFVHSFPAEGVLWDDSYHHLTIAQSIYDGRGFVVDVIWPLNLRSPSFPQPYFFRQPVYPFLVALSYRLFGVGVFSARLVNVVCESLLVSVTFLLGFSLSKSVRAGVLAAVIYCFGFLPLYLAPQAMTESVFSLFVSVFFLSVVLLEGRFQSVFLGLCVGLAYLTREQGLLLIPALAVYHLLKSGGLRGLVKVGPVLFVAFLVVSPWLLRVYLLTGNPLYSINLYSFLLLRGDDRFFAGIDAPRPPLELLAGRLNARTFLDYFDVLWGLLVGHAILLPSVLLVILPILERQRLKLHLASSRGFYGMFLAYYVLLFLAASFMYGFYRYLYSVIPVFAVVSGICLDWLFRDFFELVGGLMDVFFQSAVVCILVLSNVSMVMASMGDGRQLGEISAAYWLSGKVGERDVVMGYYPFYVPYILGVKAVQVPSEERYLLPIVREYNVTYVLYGTVRSWFNVTDSEHFKEVHSQDGWAVYEVVGVT